MTAPVTAAGPIAFARFAYPPNALGYCGPADPDALLESAVDGVDLAMVAALASRFDGAWPYLQLIAGCNHIDDPLDPAVVDAYWIGNALLDRVPVAVLEAHLAERFERRAGRDFTGVAAAARTGGIPHHSFHVFAVYPWLGLLRAGMEGAPLRVLDQCRIREGTVVAVCGDELVVRSRGLGFDGHRLVDGPEREERVRRSVAGLGFASDLAPGDAVALHWDWVCQRLSPDERIRLRRCTRRVLRVVKALEAPGPIVAVDARGDG